MNILTSTTLLLLSLVIKMMVMMVTIIDCRIIHEHGYTPEECLTYRPVVYSNVTQSLVAIVRAANQLNIEFEQSDRAVRHRVHRLKIVASLEADRPG